MQETAKDLAGTGRDDNTGFGLVQTKDAVDLIDTRGCNGNGVVNNRPTITGNPANSVNEGVAYQFIPTVADVDVGDTLTLGISNKPAWANFDAATGELSGAPADGDTGIYNDISITVTDSKGASASTLLFSIEVVDIDFPVPPQDIEQYLERNGSDIVLLNPDGSIKSQVSVNDGDADSTNELQTLSQTGSTVTLTDGGSVSINDADADPANELQTITLLDNTVTLSHNGGSFLLGNVNANNEVQTLQAVLNQGNNGGGKEIVNIAEPTTPQSAVTKAYVDAKLSVNRHSIYHSDGITKVAKLLSPPSALVAEWVFLNNSNQVVSLGMIGTDYITEYLMFTGDNCTGNIYSAQAKGIYSYGYNSNKLYKKSTTAPNDPYGSSEPIKSVHFLGTCQSHAGSSISMHRLDEYTDPNCGPYPCKLIAD
jgi:hypothetical protein